MARLQKAGLNYFPFDVDLLTDEKLDSIKLKYGGALSCFVYIALLTRLYKDKGYYIPYETQNEKSACISYVLKACIGKFQPAPETITGIIEGLVEQRLFSGCHYHKIITSRRCQSTYYSATVERQLVVIDSDIWMLSLEEMKNLSAKHSYYLLKVSRPINEDNRPIEDDNRPISTQIKSNQTDDNTSNTILTTRTREEWEKQLSWCVNVDNSSMLMEQCFNDGNSATEIINLLLDFLNKGEDIEIGDKIYKFEMVAKKITKVTDMEFLTLLQNLYKKENTPTQTWKKRKINNLLHYVITSLTLGAEGAKCK